MQRMPVTETEDEMNSLKEYIDMQLAEIRRSQRLQATIFMEKLINLHDKTIKLIENYERVEKILDKYEKS